MFTAKTDCRHQRSDSVSVCQVNVCLEPFSREEIDHIQVDGDMCQAPVVMLPDTVTQLLEVTGTAEVGPGRQEGGQDEGKRLEPDEGISSSSKRDYMPV